jgi:hypothetical protein
MSQFIYESVSEFAAASRDLKAREGQYNAGRTNSSSMSWDEGMGFEGAVEMGLTGGASWKRGTERMLKATADIEALKSLENVIEHDADITGHTLDVVDFLTGVPDCWDNSEEFPREILRVGIQLYTPGSNPIDEYINRGAAIMSVLDDVIAQGVDVELWGCVSGKSRSARSRGAAIDARILIKGAEHAWTPSAVAFALCHPAMSRRLGFNIAESDPEMQKAAGDFPGHCLDFDDDEPEDSNFDLWIGYRDMLASNYGTPKRALNRINRLVAEAVKAKVAPAMEKAA